MNRTLIFSSAALLAAAASFTSVNSQQNEMSFFITSVGSGDGANLGGLSGADATASSSLRLRAQAAKPGGPI